MSNFKALIRLNLYVILISAGISAAFWPACAEAQKTEKALVDSLTERLASAKPDTNGCKLYDRLSEVWLNRDPIMACSYTGKAMSLAKKIEVSAWKGHGGNINVESIEGDGSEFVVSLPV